LDIPPGCKLSDVKSKWLVDNLKAVIKDLTSSFICEILFDKEETLAHDVFIYRLSKIHSELLQSHQLRKLVFSRLVD
jgi:hypothetical protein